MMIQNFEVHISLETGFFVLFSGHHFCVFVVIHNDFLPYLICFLVEGSDDPRAYHLWMMSTRGEFFVVLIFRLTSHFFSSSTTMFIFTNTVLKICVGDIASKDLPRVVQYSTTKGRQPSPLE